MNRVTQLLHRMNFLGRQSKVVDHSHKYVITDRDVRKSNRVSSSRGPESRREEKSVSIEQMLEGFEPLGDAPSNALDRRLLFEVTGL